MIITDRQKVIDAKIASFFLSINNVLEPIIIEKGADPITFHERHDNDEGYSITTTTISWDKNDELPKKGIVNDGTDCDGRVTTCHELTFQSYIFAGSIHRRATWVPESCSHRDYQAELANY